MSRRFMTRRQLLRGIGGAGALATLSPFMPLVRGRADDAYPTRLLIFTTMMGMSSRYSDVWTPAGGERSFTFPTGSILEPLTPFRDRLVVMHGLENEGAKDTDLPGGHPRGLGTLLTGAPLVPGPGMVGGGDRDWTARTGGPSVDQHIASELGVRSMEVALHTSRRLPPATYKTRMSFRSANEPLAPDINPASVLDRFFGGVTAGDAPDPVVEALRARRGHILDYVREDLATLEGRLGAEDRFKLEAHLATLDRVQTELDGPAPAHCEIPAGGGRTDVPETAALHMELIKSAFSCDVARVASIMWGTAPHGWRFGWLGRSLSDGFHSLSHRGPTSGGAQDDMLRACRWYAEQLHDLLALLDSVPEGSGTLLDHTLVLWCTEVSRGDQHSNSNLPFVLAGGTDRIDTGRYLRFDGLPHNHLLISLCQAMGLTDDTFGEARYGSGPLPGLLRT